MILGIHRLVMLGSRALREIMCGCDTLGNKVRPDDFKNSGFKHNLQSFRVLKDIQRFILIKMEQKILKK